jgi:valyl-tRNA synthetase
VQIVVDEATFVIPLEGIIDLDAERARISKAIEAAAKEAKSLRRPPVEPRFRRKGQSRSRRKGPRRPCRKGGRCRTAERSAGAVSRLG